MAAAIELRGVSMVRRTQEELHYDLKRTALEMVRGRFRPIQRHTVLNGIDLVIEHGEKVGIVGPNGSGKSTLLKLIARVLRPTTGTVAIEGSLAPLIEIGVGFDPDLTLVDNIAYYGVLMGHEEALVRAHVDPILEFAELSDIRDQPTKTLSSGMSARLGFAIATEFRPDILLLDEVLAVGDERFRRKCTARIDRFWDAQSTIVLVSHDLASIARTCDRVLWIDGGRIRFDGAAQAGVEQYLASVSGSNGSSNGFSAGADLVDLARCSKKGEIAVRGTSASLQGFQVYLIRGDGLRHGISNDEFSLRSDYAWEDIIHVDDAVLLEVPEGERVS
ncbi:MAG: lipopolysaccharide transport system ATP-binding protein [Candidatus Eremiobacteraeota bacterium]|nr:lipopolysaccharide transport system ATP-binding protein [Candidatus Eremiobacteraeota bacterium]